MGESGAGRFAGRVAVVTGAGAGIGAVYAQQLASEGASVALADIDHDRARDAADGIAGAGGDAIAVHVDVADPQSALAMAATTVEAFGGIDLLVNNAAIYAGMRLEGLLSVDVEYYRHFMEVNLHGALWCTRACAPSMRERGRGAIVNQSSTAAWMGAGFYGLAKTGVNGLTQCLANELGPQGIRVNALAPGITDTEATRSIVPESAVEMVTADMILKRMGTPEDMAAMCLFLLSDDAAWITGQIVNVDGGQVLRP